MEVRLIPGQEACIRQAIESGRFQREEVSPWEERERNPAEFLAPQDDAKPSLACGEGRVVTQQSIWGTC